MTKIEREIEIKLSPREVWNALADFGNICHGHPAVKKSHVTSHQKQGLGATRHCDFTMMGASAEERVVEWNDGRNIKISVYELRNMPGIKIIELDLIVRGDHDHSVLKGVMVYSMKNAFFDLFNTLVMKRMNTTLLQGILAGHKKYMETGEVVTDKTKLNLKLVRTV